MTAAAMELLLQRARSRARALRAVSDLASIAYLDCTWRWRSQAWPSGEEEQQEEEPEESDLQQQEPPLAVAMESLSQLKDLSQAITNWATENVKVADEKLASGSGGCMGHTEGRHSECSHQGTMIPRSNEHSQGREGNI